MSQEDFEDNPHHKCWGCSSFTMNPYINQFYCSYGYMHIVADEAINQPVTCEKLCDNKRPKLRGKTSILLRLVAIHKRIIVGSLPPELVGCIGNLISYNIVKYANNIDVNIMKHNKLKTISEKVLCYNDSKKVE